MTAVTPTKHRRMTASRIWVITLLLVQHSPVINGFECNGHTVPNGFEVFIENEGYDCLKRVSDMPNITLDESFSPEEEKQVLIKLYHATSGHHWCNNTGWLNSSMHHCLWHGITCYKDAPYVKSIQLAFNNLNGFLTDDLWKLRNLLALCPNDNPALGGQFKEFLHANMSKLLALSITRTSYSGIIPPQITKLANLQTLLACNMVGEKLSGALPEDLGNMAELRLLGIGGNKFTGSIPRSISRLSKLYYIELQNTQGLLKGDLHELLSLKSLSFIFISGLTLKGSLPDPLSCLLSRVVLPGNNIKGKLPSSFKCRPGAANLKNINLSNNLLSGDIPRMFFTSHHLVQVDFSGNRFTSLNNGTKLKPEGNISVTLKFLSLAGNRNISFDFESFDKYVYQNFPNIVTLNLNNCGIQGKLSGLWWFSYSLLTIDLGNNQFYGTIPEINGPDNIPLTYLDLSNNNLTGSVPQSLYTATTLQYFNITGNPEMSDGGGAKNAMNPKFLRPDFQNMLKVKNSDNFTCPQVRFTFNDGHVHLEPSNYGYRYCVCDEGHYGTSGVCHECMSGAVCEKPEVKDWQDLNKSFMIMNKGFWPQPIPNNVSHLGQCFSSKACNPSGDCSCWLESTNGTLTQPYQPLTHCNSSCLCSYGNTGRFCSRCLDGFYKSSQICFECAKDRPKLYISVLPVVVSILILWWSFSNSNFHRRIAYAAVVTQELLMLILVILGVVPGWVFGFSLFVFVSVIYSKRDELHSLIKIAMFYVQLLDSMISFAPNVWPEEVLSTQHYFSGLWNLHFTDLSCNFTILFTPVGKLLSTLLLPIACITLTWLYCAAKLVYQKLRKRSEDRTGLTFTCRRITITILNFTYFPIVAATISALTPCEEDSGISYMPSVPWVECPSRIHSILRSLGWASLALYVISVPYFVFLPLLLRHRKIIQEDSTVDDPELQSWLEPLCSSYKPCRYFCEIVLLSRRLLLASALSFLKIYPSWQTVLICSVLTVSLAVHLLLKPYKSASNHFPFENTLEAVVLAVLLNSFAALRFITSDSTGAIVWLVMVANSLVMLGFILSAVFLTYSKRNRSTRLHQEYTRL